MPALLSALEPGAQEDGVLNRLQVRVERLVRVRPVDTVAGDDPRSVLARIEVSTARNDIEGAVAEFTKLPPPARALAQKWIEKAQQRIAALDASRKLSERSLGALGKLPSE
jgi:hypothetical protein